MENRIKEHTIRLKLLKIGAQIRLPLLSVRSALGATHLGNAMDYFGGQLSAVPV